jgi:alginate O-acetyltransferase complex protein AlgI
MPQGGAGSAIGLGSPLCWLWCNFGISNVLTSLMWIAGYRVQPLFDDPLRSLSVRDFWTHRWNRAFVEMDRRMFLRPLTRLFGLRGAVLGVFLISGLLHEMAISYPAGAGWGGPFAYFALQGLFVLTEKRWRLRGRIWTWCAILVPLPALFHQPFRDRLIHPLFLWLHNQLATRPVEWWFDKGLWVLGALQLCVLLASIQVPARLRWREELPRLSAFNQKLMWTYGATIVLVITGFGTATLFLHASMLRGDPAALAIAGFIAVFWTLRVLCDAFYFKSEDWPKGPKFEVGHVLLNTLFVTLIVGYGGLVVWRLV